MTFYLKYRPQKLEELDIAEVRESLKKTMSSGNIPHAFLFSGPKGTGKTSAARIIAKIVNCEKKGSEPCNKCEQCLSITKGSNIDVIELDAASHRGIDDVRTLKDAVKLAPARARKKVYIIDEAHMLTVEASNALLKTLEEPPSHVVFILATTNPEKLIETIRSRVVNINFRKATAPELVSSLARIVRGEKLKIDKEALSSVALFASGSFRDAAKILEQVVTEKKSPDAKFVEEFLFKKKSFDAGEFVALLSEKNTKKALEVVSQVIKNGGSMQMLIQTLLVKFREGLLGKIGVGEDTLPKFSKSELLSLIELFSRAQRELRDAAIEELPVEIAVIRWGEEGTGEVEPERPGGNLISLDNKKSNPPVYKVAPANPSPPDQNLGSPLARLKSSPPPFTKDISGETWGKILELVRPLNASIEALLRAAKPIAYDGRVLTLGVFYRFHKERLEDVPHRKVLEDVVSSVLGVQARISCVLTEPPVKEAAREVKKEEPLLTEGADKDIIKAAEEIFGN
ncbi:DNA polymerase III subunit gamma/tau [Candidatus Woesebacteria bacterium]|nr:DNA polymerase III subunit gamma/tau [Candidatus Woesebacteria bacterium]